MPSWILDQSFFGDGGGVDATSGDHGRIGVAHRQGKLALDVIAVEHGPQADLLELFREIASCARSFNRPNAGSSIKARMPIAQTTVSSSIKVNFGRILRSPDFAPEALDRCRSGAIAGSCLLIADCRGWTSGNPELSCDTKKPDLSM